MRVERGFTLIELLVTLAIIVIMAAIAFPSYTSHVRKSNRTAAQAQLLDIANREQQFLMATRAYASKTDLETSGYRLPTSLGNVYTYDITTATTPPAFTVTFTATGSQASDGGLTLTGEGARGCLPAPCATSKQW